MTSTTESPLVTQHRRIVTTVPGPRSQALFLRRASTVSAGVGNTLPVFVDRAAGGVLVDVDGNSFIDMSAGIGALNVGSSAPSVVAAMVEQAGRLTHTCFSVAPYETYLDLCDELAAVTPGSHDKRSVLFNTGAEAVENAVKIARAATGRQAVVVFDNAFHGRTYLTMAMTAKNMPFKHHFGPFSPEVYRVSGSYPFRDPDGMTGEQAAARAIGEIETQIGGGNVAAMVIEPVQGEGGFIVPAPGFLPALHAWCRANGVVFVADEIQSGFCRTGDWFAADHEGVIPDLVTTAKGLAGGMPISAVTGRADLMDSVHVGGLGGTYAGNPVACAAAVAAVRMMHELELCSAARVLGDVLLPRLHALKDRIPAVGDVRGRGAMVAVELVRPGTKEPDAELTANVVAACHAAGVLVLTAGLFGNVLRFLPPLVSSPELVAEALGVIEDALNKAAGGCE